MSTPVGILSAVEVGRRDRTGDAPSARVPGGDGSPLAAPAQPGPRGGRSQAALPRVPTVWPCYRRPIAYRSVPLPHPPATMVVVLAVAPSGGGRPLGDSVEPFRLAPHRRRRAISAIGRAAIVRITVLASPSSPVPPSTTRVRRRHRYHPLRRQRDRNQDRGRDRSSHRSVGHWNLPDCRRFGIGVDRLPSGAGIRVADRTSVVAVLDLESSTTSARILLIWRASARGSRHRRGRSADGAAAPGTCVFGEDVSVYPLSR